MDAATTVIITILCAGFCEYVHGEWYRRYAHAAVTVEFQRIHAAKVLLERVDTVTVCLWPREKRAYLSPLAWTMSSLPWPEPRDRLVLEDAQACCVR